MPNPLEKKVFIICPVRNATNEEAIYLQDYVNRLEHNRYKVHFPPQDTNQDDPNGLNICSENREAIRNADEVHVYWNNSSSGSGFDFGMAFMLEKPIKFINKDKIPRTRTKSFQNVLHELDSMYGLL
ncbi:hypothetical protein CL621_01625 [archaeon]|nr:hypothetical protein [archaeon]|tara:strand:+ start:103 stop:483 length:381 start_codon:yes stop_codon:yes gene_type:complete